MSEEQTVLPKVGDVRADGAIQITASTAARSGVVVIHRSRLRRAQRFGWAVTHITRPLADYLVAVSR